METRNSNIIPQPALFNFSHTPRFEGTSNCISSTAPMDLYQQHQEQQQLAPSTYTSTTQNVYAQYGTNPDGYIQYPTNHLYQQQTSTTTEQMTRAPMGYSADPVTKAVMDNILGKLPTKKNQLVFRCDICSMDFSGQSVLDMHLTGAKHAKKIKSMQILSELTTSGQLTSVSSTLRCEACGIDANSSQQLQTHLAGNKHKQRMAKLASGGGSSSIPAPVPAPVLPPPPIPDSILMPPPMAFPGPSAAQPAVPGEETLNSGRYYCEVCDLPLNSAFQLSQHQESRKHKEKTAGRTRHHLQVARFKQSSKKKKKKKGPLAYMTPLSASFVPGSML